MKIAKIIKFVLYLLVVKIHKIIVSTTVCKKPVSCTLDFFVNKHLCTLSLWFRFSAWQSDLAHRTRKITGAAETFWQIPRGD